MPLALVVGASLALSGCAAGHAPDRAGRAPASAPAAFGPDQCGAPFGDQLTLNGAVVADGVHPADETLTAPSDKAMRLRVVRNTGGAGDLADLSASVLPPTASNDSAGAASAGSTARAHASAHAANGSAEVTFPAGSVSPGNYKLRVVTSAHVGGSGCPSDASFTQMFDLVMT
jgi:hypothetical protein